MSKSYLFLIAALILFQGCTDSSTGPDLDELAPPPYDRSQAVRDTTLAGGIEVFVIKEGHGAFEVVSQDQLLVRYTGRTTEGKVFFTSYRGNRVTNLSSLLNLTPAIRVNTPPAVEGLRKGVIGMKEGEKRSIVVPPTAGYQSPPSRFAPCNPSPCTNGIDLRGKTIVFDVELVEIQE